MNRNTVAKAYAELDSETQAKLRQRLRNELRTNTYDANGRVQTQTRPDSTTYQFAYTLDGSGNLWARPLSDFLATVERDGYKGQRFVYKK